ncbi:hypothetical protein EN816_06770 [Mesorhizobium sp. M8A.F.Ca.ET.173.01.1.1]|nr:hypothetical protein EN816_06770 [Mesorhizobium sp. M8A.F.Ca.ET.173.01.1.1]
MSLQAFQNSQQVDLIIPAFDIAASSRICVHLLLLVTLTSSTTIYRDRTMRLKAPVDASHEGNPNAVAWRVRTASRARDIPTCLKELANLFLNQVDAASGHAVGEP